MQMTIAMRLTNPLNGAHGHWAVKARRRKEQRDMILQAWMAYRLPQHLEPGQRVKLVRIGPRRLDGDNLQAACKSVRDAAAEMLGINDRLDVWLYDQESGKYGVRIEITGS